MKQVTVTIINGHGYVSTSARLADADQSEEDRIAERIQEYRRSQGDAPLVLPLTIHYTEEG